VAQTLRPLTIGELLDRTFFYYRRHFVLFVGIAALPSVVLLVFQLAAVSAKFNEGGPLVTVIIALATLFVYLVTGTLAHGATVVAVSQILLGRETSIAEAFTSIRPRIGELIRISVNVSVRVMLGLLLLIVPGVLLALRYSLTIPVAVLEETGVSASLSRSRTLTKGHLGRILLVYFLLFALIIVVSMIWPFLTMAVGAMFSSAVRAGQQPLWVKVVLQFGNFVSQALLSPVMTIALTLVYYDERVRKEAFDLEHMMRQLDTVVHLTPRLA
jgi:hypothetical protein